MPFFIGSSIPLVIYLVWELLILGIIPTQELIAANAKGQNAVGPLKELVPQVFNIGRFFGMFLDGSVKT